MREFAYAVARGGVRVLLLLVGLVVLAAVLLACCLMAVGWTLRALWLRLTGQPVPHWGGLLHGSLRRASGNWEQVYRRRAPSRQQEAGPQATVHGEGHAPARTRRTGGVFASVASDVTDVQPREVREGTPG